MFANEVKYFLNYCPVNVFRRGMSNAICDPMLYLESEGLKFFLIISSDTLDNLKSLHTLHEVLM